MSNREPMPRYTPTDLDAFVADLRVEDELVCGRRRAVEYGVPEEFLDPAAVGLRPVADIYVDLVRSHLGGGKCGSVGWQ